MPFQIKLKRKYRRGFKSRYKGGENFAPKKHRKKIGHANHVKLYGEPLLTVMMVNGRNGKSVFKTTGHE